MGKFLFDKDVRLTPLRNKTIGVLGYGNQGRAQALNLRDSGCEVIIGNRRDRYRKTAVEDGFDVSPISVVVPRADILIIAIPDEIQQQVYEKHIRDHLRPGQVMDFASSYGIRFECIVPPDDIDVVMMSPRAMGVTVREAYEADKGVPGFVAVWQDVSGKARQVALALAKAVGCTRAGVFECRFEDESDINLLGEQGLWPLFTQQVDVRFVLEPALEHTGPCASPGLGQSQGDLASLARDVLPDGHKARHTLARLVGLADRDTHGAWRHHHHVDVIGWHDALEPDPVAAGEVHDLPGQQVVADVLLVDLLLDFVGDRDDQDVGPGDDLADRCDVEAVGDGGLVVSVASIADDDVAPAVSQVQRLCPALVAVTQYADCLVPQRSDPHDLVE